jgi:hypothetical protein
MRRSFVAAVVLTIAGLGGSALHALTPQNQCPGDCSPCLGPTDPFCTTTTIDASSSSGRFCVLCESPKGNCVDAQPGQSGKDQSCTVVTRGTIIVSCTNSGNQCTGSSVIP